MDNKHTQGKVKIGSEPFDENSFYSLMGREGVVAEVSHGGSGDYDEHKENAVRIAALWNTADGMTTEEAVRYLEHGREMAEELAWAMDTFLEKDPLHFTGNKIKKLIAKMEGK